MGFTLIELSIVLVIIALIVGGILVGRDLIRVTEARMQVAQIGELNTAVHTFKVKYDCVPGDCIHAVQDGLGATGGPGDNGNGNGRLDNTSYPFSDSLEMRGFWYHLSAAHLLSGPFPDGNVPGVNSPPLKMKGQGIEGNASGGVWFANVYLIGNVAENGFKNTWFLTTTSLGGVVSGVYLPADALMLDEKLDDGLPYTGLMRPASGSISGYCAGNPVQCFNAHVATTSEFPDACVDDSDPAQAVYHASSQTPSITSLCSLVIKAPY